MTVIDDDSELLALLASAAPQQDVEVADGDTAFKALLMEFRRRRDLKDSLSAAAKMNEAELEKIIDTAVGVFEQRGIKSIKIAGVGTIGTAINNNPSVEDNEALMQWLFDIGQEGSIKRTVHYMTLKSLLNERMEQGLAIPPETVVKVTSRNTLKLTRSK